MSGNTSRRKGARWESTLATYLQQWWPHLHRNTPGQHVDRGDLHGIHGWTIEAKDCATWRVSEWWTQATHAADRNGHTRAALIVKRKGDTDPAHAWVITDLATWVTTQEGTAQ